ncbi:DUF58 domain-containing protein (plasmid) [Halorussus limi]|uniref:DUF58 domain-containing protein n=1 Tax=Halorussus limi TaxID=2938695 RepID=A0A8U0I1D0_9EURY|nr:DUF58 domain-containing protein [Halorussus limi]UPV76843.1 DUF58 domain-containing protein [Halorussus limi]
MTETRRWRGVVAVTLLVGGVGLVADRPDLVLVSVVGVAFAAYPRLSPAPPETPDLEIERRLSERAPSPGETVEVSVTVRNAGDQTLFDLRVVDGVPPALTVTSGSPRYGGPLRPGGEATFEYAVETDEGKHGFDPATAVVRDPSGEREVETTVSAETEIDCTVAGGAPPRRNLAVEDAGDLLTDHGGVGVEFHQTREYRRGDAMSRIDWKRFARAGELTTVEYREERSASVVLLVDARAPAYRASEGEPHAVVRSVAAAQRLAGSLLTGRNRVGVAALGRENCWLPPGAGTDHRTRAMRTLATHSAFAASPPNDDAEEPIADRVARVRRQLSPDTQVTFLTPLCDDDAVTAASTLEAHGHSVTVVSPDATGDATPGRRLAATERENRIAALRRREIPVLDWGTDDGLAAAVAKAGDRGAL